MNNWFKFLFALGCVLCEGVSAFTTGPCCPDNLYGYAYNPPLTYGCDWCGLSGHLEYLYWKPDLRLNVATVVNSSKSPKGNLSTAKAELRRLRFEWDYGFRVGFDYKLPCDRWELNLIWTHFQTHHHDADLNLSSISSGSNITGIFPIFNDDIEIAFKTQFNHQKLKNEAHIQYNNIDILFQRDYFTGKRLTLTPFGGIKLLFDTNRYENSFNATSIDFPQLFTNYFSKNKYIGVGLTTGLKTYWDIFCNLGIETAGSFSLLYGNTRVITNSFNSSIGNTGFGPQLGVSASQSYAFQEINYTLDGGIYLRWLECICGGKGLFSVRFGWEAHFISDQNRLFVDTNAQTPNQNQYNSGYIKESPLTFQGLVLGISASM